MKNNTKVIICLLVGVLLIYTIPSLALDKSTVVNTVHNLSTSGPGDIKSSTENKVCVFCHTPHNSNPATALWNHNSQTTYTLYNSSTFYGATSISNPDGTSKLCLSCHDGTIALGDMLNKDVAVGDSSGTKLDASESFVDTAAANLGTDISNDHPISFVYDSTLVANDGQVKELKDPSVALSGLGGTISQDLLDASSKMQCTSCHKPHENTNGNFLVKPNSDGTYGSLVCATCHKMGKESTGETWLNSAHRNGTAIDYADKDGDGTLETMAQWGCQACHNQHGNPTGPRLKKRTEEQDCYECHDGTVSAEAPDIRGQFLKKTTHPVPDKSGVHDPAEDYQDMSVRGDRHAECQDCHNPHTAQTGTHQAAPAIPASLRGIDGLGVSFSGAWDGTSTWSGVTFTYKEVIDDEYELCLKCHSSYSYGSSPPDSPSRKALEGTGATTADGDPVSYKQTPIAKQFNPNNASMHAVFAPHPDAGTGRAGVFNGTDRDGEPWGWDSQMLCTDCHGNSEKTDPIQGPHGSDFYFMLKGPWNRTYRQSSEWDWDDDEYRTGRSGTSDHLCFQCHDYGYYTGNGDDDHRWDGSSYGSSSGFTDGGSWGSGKNLHDEHNDYGCNACHSMVPHGWYKKAFLVEQSDPSPYSDGSLLRVSNWSSSGNWNESDCQGSHEYVDDC